MPNLIIPVGIPGCGKSTFARLMPNITVVSSDAIRREINDGKYLVTTTGKGSNTNVFEIFHHRIVRALWLNHDVFADATNLDRFARHDLLDDAADAPDVKVHVVLFKNNDQALYRNRQRDPEVSQVVPDDVMQRMIEKYERTLLELPQEQYYSVTEVSGVR